MSLLIRIAASAASLLSCFALAPAQVEAIDLPAEITVPAGVDFGASFTLRMLVRSTAPPPSGLPALVANKAWESGPVRDYTTNNSYGLGRDSGSQAGFAISSGRTRAARVVCTVVCHRQDQFPPAAFRALGNGR